MDTVAFPHITDTNIHLEPQRRPYAPDAPMRVTNPRSSRFIERCHHGLPAAPGEMCQPFESGKHLPALLRQVDPAVVSAARDTTRLVPVEKAPASACCRASAQFCTAKRAACGVPLQGVGCREVQMNIASIFDWFAQDSAYAAEHNDEPRQRGMWLQLAEQWEAAALQASNGLEAAE